MRQFVAISIFLLLGSIIVHGNAINKIIKHKNESPKDLNFLWDSYAFHVDSNLDSALFYLQEIRKTSIESRKMDWLSASYAATAHIKEQQGYLGAAATNYYEAINILESLPSSNARLADNFNNISNIFRVTGEYTTALNYVNKAINIFKKEVNKELELTISLRNKGLYLLETNKYNLAHDAVDEALEIAIAKNFKEEIAYLLNLKGDIFLKQGLLFDGKKSYSKGLTYAEDYLILSYLNHNLGETYLITQNYDSANLYFNIALNLNQTPDRLNAISLKRTTYNQLARTALLNNDTTLASQYLVNCILVDTANMVDEQANIYESLKMLSVIANSKSIKYNSILARCNELMLDYMSQLQKLKDELGLLNRQYVVNFASEKHALTTQVHNAEEKRKQIWQAFWIPVALSIMLGIGFLFLIKRIHKTRRYAREIDLLLED